MQLNHLNRQLLPSGQIIISALSKHPILSAHPRGGSSSRDYRVESSKRGRQPTLAPDGEVNMDGEIHVPFKIVN